MNTNKFLVLMEYREAIHEEKICSKSLLPITYKSKTPSSTIAQKSMSPTPASPQTIIQLAFQACMMYLHAHNHCIKEYMTAKQYYMVLTVITKQ